MNDASQVITPARREVKKRRNTDAMIGRRFGRWTILEYVGHHTDGHAQFKCRCDCGVEHIVFGYSMTRGQSVSCGCYSKESLSRRQTTHGETRGHIQSPEHIAWRAMIQRCEDENNISYPHYGARGIQVCDLWRNSFSAFLECVGRRPSIEHSIGRIDNEGNYEPNNCEWQAAEAQANNKRTSRKFTHGGITLTVAQWSRRTGLSEAKLSYRLVRARWNVARALELD